MNTMPKLRFQRWIQFCSYSVCHWIVINENHFLPFLFEVMKVMWQTPWPFKLKAIHAPVLIILDYRDVQDKKLCIPNVPEVECDYVTWCWTMSSKPEQSNGAFGEVYDQDRKTIVLSVLCFFSFFILSQFSAERLVSTL
jgi:hypothetical protein